MNRHAREVCASKRAFPTETSAKVHALGEMNHPDKKRRSADPIHTYLCDVCGLYHLTRLSRIEWAKRQRSSMRNAPDQRRDEP